ncbi:MAG: hypothetical protein JSS58_05725 [Proteobacteria bacterium]|nr:hypothetical protein [Pseudomonadota bacterium]
MQASIIAPTGEAAQTVVTTSQGEILSSNPYSNPTVHVEDYVRPEGEAPPLWNPNAAANWSLLFSAAFGAYLHMKNWQALGEPEKAATAKQWMIWSLVLVFSVPLFGIFFIDIKALDALSRSAGIGMLVAWYISNARGQAAYVKERFGADYARKGWFMPILLGILLIAIVFAVGFLAGLFTALARHA